MSKNLSRDTNTFEDLSVAKGWIASIESKQNGSREKEIYPMLYKWTHELSPKILVDIGAGQGICSEKVDISKGKYVGIEPSNLLVTRAKELYKEKNKEFLVGTAYRIPLSAESADAVFSLGVWFHIKDLDKAHSEIARILKPNGEVLIITANPDTYHLWESWFDKPKREGKILMGEFNLPGKVLVKNIFYLHSEAEIVDSLKKYSINVVSVEKFGFGKANERKEGIWMVIRGIKK